MAQLGAWAVVGALVVGCGTSPSGGADSGALRDGGAPDAPALVDAAAGNGAVRVRVVSATFDQELLHAGGSGDRRIRLRVEVEVSNVGSDAPVGVRASAFSLVSSAGRTVRPDGVTSCGAADPRAVPRGANTRCAFAFETTGLTVRALVFTAAGQPEVSVAFGPYDLAAELAPRNSCERLFARRDELACVQCMTGACRDTENQYLACRQQVAMSPPVVDWVREYCEGFTAVLTRCGGFFDARVECIGLRCATACQP
jgi:hypothetical protein